MGIARTTAFALALLGSSAAYAGTPGWSLSETSGQVTVVSTGLSKIATRGSNVATGDVISTGRTGRAVLVRGEEYLVVAPNSRIRVADPAKAGRFTQIIEDFGNVIYKIKKMTMPHFAVETPFLAAVVKGTTFSVTVTDKGASVQVIEGKVEVATRDGGASFMVLPGDIGSVNANAPGALNMQGRETRTITSPTPVAAAAAVTASLVDRVVSPDQVQLSGAVSDAISEGPVDLAAMSDGMVKGDSAMMAMASMMKSTTEEAPDATPAATPAATPTETSVVTTGLAVAVPSTKPTAVPPVMVEEPVPPTPVTVVALPAAPLPPVVAAPLPAPVEIVAAPESPAPVVVVAAPVPVDPVTVVAAPLPAPVVAAPLPAPVAVVAAPLPDPVVVVAAPLPPEPVAIVAAPLPAPAPLQPIVAIVAPIIQPIVATLPALIGGGNVSPLGGNGNNNNQGNNNSQNE